MGGRREKGKLERISRRKTGRVEARRGMGREGR